MSGRRHVVGVDFSGARDAGNRIWIAEGEIENGAVRIETCFPARDLPGSAAARRAALAALVEFLAAQDGAVIGLDFPFGLPVPLIAEATWEAFVAAFPARYGSAEGFRAACNEAAGGRELKRRTDVEARTPFAVYNLRLFRQTYAGIAEVLRPLVATDAARVLPMQHPVDGKPVIAEICPASLLKSRGLYPSYKGRRDAHRRARRSIVRGLAARGLLAPLTARIARTVVADHGGDALDSVVAALGAAVAAGRRGGAPPVDRLDAIEGRVIY